MQLKGGIDHASEFGFTEKGAEVYVAELQDAQTVEVVRQAGKRDIHFADAKIGALNECAVAHGSEGRGHQRAAGGVEHAAAIRVYVGVQNLAQASEEPGKSPSTPVRVMK